jgi:anti-sigma factor RsiW
VERRGAMVTRRGCVEWRGELAAHVLGVAAPGHDTAFAAHLDGCTACRAELQELQAAADALGLADPSRIGSTEPAPFLADVIIERVAGEAAEARRTRRRRVLVPAIAAAVAAILAVTALVAGLTADDAPAAVELSGAAGASASAVLTDRAWGTEIALDVEGLDDGEMYWLWLTGDDGDRVGAGTLMGTGRPAHAVLAAALPAEDARRIWMTDVDERVVLDAVIDSS